MSLVDDREVPRRGGESLSDIRRVVCEGDGRGDDCALGPLKRAVLFVEHFTESVPVCRDRLYAETFDLGDELIAEHDGRNENQYAGIRVLA
jgi:hypothetical protein